MATATVIILTIAVIAGLAFGIASFGASVIVAVFEAAVTVGTWLIPVAAVATFLKLVVFK